MTKIFRIKIFEDSFFIVILFRVINIFLIQWLLLHLQSQTENYFDILHLIILTVKLEVAICPSDVSQLNAIIFF